MAYTREVHDVQGVYAGYARFDNNNRFLGTRGRVNTAIRTAAMRAAARERQGGTTRVVTRRRA